jgi:hypothetical protein
MVNFLHESEIRLQRVILEYQAPSVDTVAVVDVNVQFFIISDIVEVNHLEEESPHLNVKVCGFIFFAFRSDINVGQLCLHEGLELLDMAKVVDPIESCPEIFTNIR